MIINLSEMLDSEIVELARSRVGRPGGRRQRRVRTPEGSRKYGLPIGAIITRDAIKRASKRFPGVKVAEDLDTGSRSSDKTGSGRRGPAGKFGPGSGASSDPAPSSRQRKTAQQIKGVLERSPDLDPKRAKFTTLAGDQAVLVGQHQHNLPAGSKVFRTKGEKSVALARTPDYNLYILTPRGRALNIQDRDTENELNERLDDLKENDPDFDIESLGVDPADAPVSEPDADPVDANLEELAGRLDQMADAADNEEQANQYRELAQNLRDQKAARPVEPSATVPEDSPKTPEKDLKDKTASAVATAGDPADSGFTAANPRRLGAGGRGGRMSSEPKKEIQKDTTGVPAKDLSDDELAAVLDDVSVAKSVGIRSPELDSRASELRIESSARKIGRSTKSDGGGSRDSGKTSRTPGKLDSATLGEGRLSPEEVQRIDPSPGKGDFENQVTDHNVILNSRTGDKFLISNGHARSLWGLEDDGRFHRLEADGNEASVSVDEFADLLNENPFFGRTDIYAFRGNEFNTATRPIPQPGDKASSQWIQDSPVGSVVADGSGLIGKKRDDGSFFTPLGVIPAEFFGPSDIEDDDTVVIRDGEDPDGRPVGSSMELISADDLKEVGVGDSVAVGDSGVFIERRPDGSFEADVDGLKIPMSKADVEHFSENGAESSWLVPNKDMVGAPSKKNWSAGDRLERLDDLTAQPVGSVFALKQDDGGQTEYTLLPNGMLGTKKSQIVPQSVLKPAIYQDRVSLIRKSDKGTVVPAPEAKKIRSISDYEDGDAVVSYTHLRDMKPGQQVTIYVKSAQNGGKSLPVVLTRTDDTKDNAGFMFLVGRRGAGYNSFGENNAAIFQAIADGRLYFGDITNLPGSRKPDMLDSNWDTSPSIELWAGGPKASQKELWDLINAQVYSRAMQSSYYNVDLLPPESIFRAKHVRDRFSQDALKKFNVVGADGKILIPARNKPAMIRAAAELLGLEYSDPGAVLIPDDLELDDFRNKVNLGRFVNGTSPNAERDKMGPEALEVSVADLKIARAIVANMLTSNQEAAMAKELGLDPKDSTPDKILKRVMAMRGSPLQDMNIALGIAAYFNVKRDKDGVRQGNITAARQHDKTRNKKLLLQMMQEQLEGREPGYYGLPEDEVWQRKDKQGNPFGPEYRNYSVLRRPAVNSDNDPNAGARWDDPQGVNTTPPPAPDAPAPNYQMLTVSIKDVELGTRIRITTANGRVYEGTLGMGRNGRGFSIKRDDLQDIFYIGEDDEAVDRLRRWGHLIEIDSIQDSGPPIPDVPDAPAVQTPDAPAVQTPDAPAVQTPDAPEVAPTSLPEEYRKIPPGGRVVARWVGEFGASYAVAYTNGRIFYHTPSGNAFDAGLADAVMRNLEASSAWKVYPGKLAQDVPEAAGRPEQVVWSFRPGDRVTAAELADAPEGTVVAYLRKSGNTTNYVKRADGWYSEKSNRRVSIEGWARAAFAVKSTPGGNNAPDAQAPDVQAPADNIPASTGANLDAAVAEVMAEAAVPRNLPKVLHGAKVGDRMLAKHLRALPNGAQVVYGGRIYTIVDGNFERVGQRFPIEKHIRKRWVLYSLPGTGAAAQNVPKPAAMPTDQTERVEWMRGKIKNLPSGKITPSTEDSSDGALKALDDHFAGGGGIWDAPPTGLWNFISVREDLFKVKALGGDKGLSDIYSIVDKRTNARFIVKNHDQIMNGIDQDAVLNDLAVLDLLQFAGVQDVQVRVANHLDDHPKVGDKIIMRDFAEVAGVPGERVVQYGRRSNFGDHLRKGPDPDALARLVLVDFLVGNEQDRHAGNLLGVDLKKRGEGRLALIDFGLAFKGRLGDRFGDYFRKTRSAMRFEVPSNLKIVYGGDRAALKQAMESELAKLLGVDLVGYRARLEAQGMSARFIDSKLDFLNARVSRMKDSGFLYEVMDNLTTQW